MTKPTPGHPTRSAPAASPRGLPGRHVPRECGEARKWGGVLRTLITAAMDSPLPTQTTNGSATDPHGLPDNPEEDELQVIGSANTDVAEVAYDEITEKKLALESLCFVLGLNYKSKMAEFGTQIDSKRLDEAISFLKVTRDGNYKQLRAIGKELIAEWKLANTPFAKMKAFSWILYIKDSTCVEELKMKCLLSTSWVNKAKRELAALKKARDEKVKKKYETTHAKLKNILEALTQKRKLPKSYTSLKGRNSSKSSKL